MLHEIFIKAFGKYENDYIKTANELNKTVLECEEDDLTDKGFSKEEVYDLTTHLFIDTKAKYKFLAYFCEMFNSSSSVNDIEKNLIEQLGECDLTKEELTKIFNCIDELD